MGLIDRVGCFLLGHEWIFPSHKLVLGASPISTGDYKCMYCGKKRELNDRSRSWIRRIF